MSGAAHDARDDQGHRERAGNRFGMWMFLLTEIVLFGTLFLFFASYFYEYEADYRHAARQLNRLIGVFNTAVLITSSLTVALAISALHRGRKAASLRWLLATVGLALVFLAAKGLEWSHKFEVGLYLDSEVLLALPRGEILFFGLYFAMTGLHALHVVMGGVLLGVAARSVYSGRVHQGRASLLENSGLFWHLVDLIWIYLFPSFYLIGR
jgi:cytochrome c oxidase subunit 3